MCVDLYDVIVPYDVIVVGCGPVGATVANLLGQHGISTLVLEKETAVYPLPRAIHFDDEVMRIFQAIGLHREIGGATRSIEGMHFLDRQGRLLLEVCKNEAQYPLYGFPAANVFHQPTLERMLRRGLDRFPCVQAWLGWGVEDLGQDETGVTVTVRCVETGERVTAHGRYLLGCDGASSTVRRLAGLSLADWGCDQPWLVVDVRLLAPMPVPDVVQQICDPARPATYVPAVDGRCRWEFMLLPGESPQEMMGVERVKALLAARVDPEQVEVERAAVYTFHALLAERWQRGRIFLLGDAAHQMPPFLGQGMCAGLRDAHNLAWKLGFVLKNWASPALLETYHQERLPHVAQILRLVRWAGAIIQTRRRWIAMLRDGLLRATMRISSIRRRARQMETMVPGLQRGCLAPQNRAAGRLFPQPLVQTRDGEETLLDSVLADGFTLLTVGPMPWTRKIRAPGPFPLCHLHVVPPGLDWPDESTGLAVRDPSGRIIHWCAELGADLVILRPDRYVFGGYRADEIRRGLAELAAALSRAQGCPARTSAGVSQQQ